MPIETRTPNVHAGRLGLAGGRHRLRLAPWLARWARCAVAALPLTAHAAPPPHWQYSGAYGPANWAEMRKDYALCGRGQRQSPIDIVATRLQAQPRLQFDYRSAPLRIVNDGHTVRVRFANGSRLLIGGHAETLQQFHFHIPGGDQVRGEAFPMAMHFLHKSRSGQLVALVVLFRLGARNEALAALLPKMPEAGQPERVLPDTRFNPADLLPASKAYYVYDGSLTAPPCTEGVRWIVMQQPLELSAAQLARLSELFPNNARPVQPLHGRVVTQVP